MICVDIWRKAKKNVSKLIQVKKLDYWTTKANIL
jgi:hypothetical protein